MSLPDHAELLCCSNFTFLRGASHPGELVARAKAMGYTALALTDECSMAGIAQAHVAAKKHALPLIVGSQFRVRGEAADTGDFTLVLLATSLKGYGNLCEFITRLRRAAASGVTVETDDTEDGGPRLKRSVSLNSADTSSAIRRRESDSSIFDPISVEKGAAITS